MLLSLVLSLAVASSAAHDVEGVDAVQIGAGIGASAGALVGILAAWQALPPEAHDYGFAGVAALATGALGAAVGGAIGALAAGGDVPEIVGAASLAGLGGPALFYVSWMPMMLGFAPAVVIGCALVGGITDQSAQVAAVIIEIGFIVVAVVGAGGGAIGGVKEGRHFALPGDEGTTLQRPAAPPPPSPLPLDPTQELPASSTSTMTGTPS